MRLAAHYVASFVLFLRRLDVETYPCLKPSAALTPSSAPLSSFGIEISLGNVAKYEMCNILARGGSK